MEVIVLRTLFGTERRDLIAPVLVLASDRGSVAAGVQLSRPARVVYRVGLVVRTAAVRARREPTRTTSCLARVMAV